MSRLSILLIRVLLLTPIYFIPQMASAQDTVMAVASSRYTHPSLTERIFIGSNYRSIWSQLVTVKVFHLNEVKGGLIVKELGGGMQTKSLRLEDAHGTKWVLRTIDKTVDKAMEAEGIGIGFIKNITQAMISAAQPYGALTVAPMARALGIVTASPELYYVADKPGLGEYSRLFANTMCLLEQREPVLHPGDKVKDTEKMLRDRKKHPDYDFDAKMLLQARLLDMLISDWDRHGGQWKWGYHKADGNVTIYPIPVDHDQAYFNSNGLLVKGVRPFAMKHIIGFRKESTGLITLNRKEWNFDYALLGSLSRKEWRSGIETFQAKLTDEVLMQAVHQLPQEIAAGYRQALYERLQSRRNTMLENGMKYYDFLQRYEPKPMKEETKVEKAVD